VVNDRRFERNNRGRRERGSPRGYVDSHPINPVPVTLKERGVDDTGITTAVKSKCEAEKAANLMQGL